MPQFPAPPPEPIRLPDSERLTWAQTRYLIRSDFQRLVASYGGGSLSKRMFWFFQPNYQAIFLYRLYRYLYVNGWRNMARLLFLYSLYLTCAEIPPTTSIGPGCFIAHALGIILCGKIGARFSIFGQAGTGGGIGTEDIGGGPGLPVIGDDVVFGIKSIALGPIRIGDRAKLGPMAFVNRDVPDDATVIALPSKTTRARGPTPIVQPNEQSAAADRADITDTPAS
jgi:serine O-acetyltransferase